MFLTTKGRYAVMALVDMVLNDQGSPTPLAAISERQHIDIAYLEQIFAKLKSENLVKAYRGPGGGYRLVKHANEVSIADIMGAVEEKLKMTRCHNQNPNSCMQTNSKCATHHLWKELEMQIARFLKSVTLEDVCRKKITVNKSMETNNLVTELYGRQ